MQADRTATYAPLNKRAVSVRTNCDWRRQMRKAVILAEAKGYITSDELNQIIPLKPQSEDIESLMSALSDKGIWVQEEQEASVGGSWSRSHERSSLRILVSGRSSFGVEIPQQPMHAETSNDQERREVRQESNCDVRPNVDLLARRTVKPLTMRGVLEVALSATVGSSDISVRGCMVVKLPWSS